MNKRKRIIGYNRWQRWCAKNFVGKPVSKELMDKSLKKLKEFMHE